MTNNMNHTDYYNDDFEVILLWEVTNTGGLYLVTKVEGTGDILDISSSIIGFQTNTTDVYLRYALYGSDVVINNSIHPIYKLEIDNYGNSY